MDTFAASILTWLVNLLMPGLPFEDFMQSDPMVVMIFIFGTIVLVLMTVSFLFKFILKLVDR